MKKVVYILLVTQVNDGQISVGLGPVYWNRIDADRAAHSFPYDGTQVQAQVITRDVRGDMPVMQTQAQASGQ